MIIKPVQLKRSEDCSPQVQVGYRKQNFETNYRCKEWGSRDRISGDRNYHSSGARNYCKISGDRKAHGAR